MSDKTKKKYSGADYTRFILPSLIGIMLFMIPLKFQGEYTIPVAILSKTVASILEPALPTIITLLITFTGIMTIIYKVAKPSFIEKSKNLKGLFNVNIFWFIVRIVGMIFIILAYFEIGPEWIWNENTGGLLLHGLLTTLLTIFFFAAFFYFLYYWILDYWNLLEQCLHQL